MCTWLKCYNSVARSLCTLIFQVDAALGAEELVETLGNDKMTLQEKVSELEEEISDLEAIKDTNDQLLEAQKEIDIELREELDMTLNAKREVCWDKLFVQIQNDVR